MKNRFLISCMATGLLAAVLFGSTTVRAADTPKAEKSTGVEVAQEQIDSGRVKEMLASIERRQKELDEREDSLKTREERLLAIKKDVEDRIKELSAVHEQIATFVKKIDETSDARVQRVAKIYASMGPEEAAARLEKLDKKTAVMILLNISERKAAKILSFVDVEKSVELSQSLKIKKASLEK